MPQKPSNESTKGKRRSRQSLKKSNKKPLSDEFSEELMKIETAPEKGAKNLPGDEFCFSKLSESQGRYFCAFS